MWRRPFEAVGILGSLGLWLVLSFVEPWDNIGWNHLRTNEHLHGASMWFDVLLAVGLPLAAIAAGATLLDRRRDGLQILWVAAVPVAAVLWPIIAATDAAWLGALAFNLVLFATGVGTIAIGIRRERLAHRQPRHGGGCSAGGGALLRFRSRLRGARARLHRRRHRFPPGQRRAVETVAAAGGGQHERASIAFLLFVSVAVAQLAVAGGAIIRSELALRDRRGLPFPHPAGRSGRCFPRPLRRDPFRPRPGAGSRRPRAAPQPVGVRAVAGRQRRSGGVRTRNPRPPRVRGLSALEIGGRLPR